MVISTIKSSAIYSYTATEIGSSISGTFTTSTLPVLEVDGIYVTSIDVSTVTTYTVATETVYTSYTSSDSWTETSTSFSRGSMYHVEEEYSSHPSETFYIEGFGTSRLTVYAPYKTMHISNAGSNITSTIGNTTSINVDGLQVNTSSSTSLVATSAYNDAYQAANDIVTIDTHYSVYTVGQSEYVTNVYTSLVYVSDNANTHVFRASGYNVEFNNIATIGRAAGGNQVTVGNSIIRRGRYTFNGYAGLTGVDTSITSHQLTYNGYTTIHSVMYQSSSV